MNTIARIRQITIDNISISFDFEQSHNTNMEMKLEATLNPPLDVKDNTALLIFKVNLSDVDGTDSLLQAVANIIFEFDDIPKDYKDAAIDVCIPIAQEEVLKRLDAILDNMGYPDFKLSGNYSMDS